MIFGMSFVYVMYRTGPRTDPWGISDEACLDSDVSPSRISLKEQTERKLSNQLSTLSGTVSYTLAVKIH